MAKNKKHTFHGNIVDVDWHGKLCIHIGECGKSEGDLFVRGRKPWCQPDLSTTDNVKDVITRCPTGALSYTVKDGSRKERCAPKNTITVSPNGPLYVQGDLSINGAAEDMTGVQFRAALCRCGKSDNKPFCDNNHVKDGFKDPGAVGSKGDLNSDEGGRLEVNPIENGPILVTGNLDIHAGSGRKAWQGNKTALCRCGASKSKPFCDGSHKNIEFVTD
ncbi:MAG: hypothetical protein HN729_02445 [Candidatus Marinimicrobia bacterium]|mgnify:FL=1|jgi:CDGSH-type Zn-finger protein/uncharacterized Fe-S cluster protein YjdI|nr:hypothetical protein [Candidatus Neomarinimicrobiota bacterium]MBT3632843.1 hypothetical protein [Candidatus Neomarinimicrobiota bacterium]MBT3681953.1 hypothetical protein [Candidatus Neomarinimicrobiota bacterium]MBT3759018.1 hypothetical protein [Candidatus Neomarinimicrobiota bacterium]MBT3895083.1 hypothetical protein [Candidatus Neomarinimicrobiota bacterium]